VRGRNSGLIADPLFVGATRPPMRWGVTYSALLFNMVFTMEAFLLTKNLLTLLLCAPIHGVCALLCARDARFFDLVLLWARTRLPAVFANLRVWKASSYSPLILDLPGRHGRRRAEVCGAHVTILRIGSATSRPPSAFPRQRTLP
jgi:type IV secretion system protein VirB3